MVDHRRAQAWTFEAPGTPGTPGTPLSTLVASNALLSRSVRRGGAAACRQRSQLMLSASSSTSGYHTKSFNIPDELARYEGPGEDGNIVGVKSVRAAIITLKINPSLPWGDHYGITPFAEGTAQRLVAEEAALLYGNPSLSTVGGFFYTLYCEKERAKGKGVANMCKPFILPRGSSWRAVPKRSAYYCPAVYIADPIRMLTPAQVAMYTKQANDHLTIDLPLCPGGAAECDDDFLESPAQSTRQLFNDIPVSASPEQHSRQTPVSEFPAHWLPMRPTLPAGTEKGGRQRVQLESWPPLCSQVDSRIPASLSRGCVDGNNHDNSSPLQPARLGVQAVSIGIEGGGVGDGTRGPLQSPTHAVDHDDDDFEPDLRIRRVRAATERRAAFRGSASGVTRGAPAHLPPVVVECSDDDFEDVPDNRFHSRIRSEEEREMIRLDEEWMRVSLAHDTLCSTEDVSGVDESKLLEEAQGHAGKNCATRFWEMLRSVRVTIVGTGDALAWDALLKRREQRRGLPESVVNDNLATVMLHPDMEMWTLSQVESFFLEQAHSDWEKWDMIEDALVTQSEQSTAAQIHKGLVGTPLEETFSLHCITGMFHRLDDWRTEDARVSNRMWEAALVRSYWRKEEVWRAYQVCNFRMRIIADYRGALSQFTPERIWVKPGTELQELRSMLQRSRTSRTPFPPMKITYAFDVGDSSFAELDTQDCGGPTRRFLGQCWTQFWNDSGVYGSIFEIANGGHTRSVKTLCKPQLNKLRTDNLELFGLLCFLLAMYGQQVDRPMTLSTIALACGWRPDEESTASIDKYEGDYQAVKPHLFTVLNALIRAKTVEEQAAAKSAILGDCDYAEIFCTVSKLVVDTPELGIDGAFRTRAREILRQQIVKVIFDGPRLAGEHMHAGFKYAMSSCAASRCTPKSAAHAISSTLITLTPEVIAPVFGAETGVDAEDFLSSCYLGSLPAVLEERFWRVVRSMSQPARYKLNKFITDSEYFSFERITVNLNSEWEKSRLPEVSTCFRTMAIPAYETDEVMATKLAYASCHTEYGNA